MAKQICFLLDWYPTRTNNGCVFAKHLICAIADMGYECVVIAPRPIHKSNFQKGLLLETFYPKTESKKSIIFLLLSSPLMIFQRL